jgi:hypothetical protein
MLPMILLPEGSKICPLPLSPKLPKKEKLDKIKS